MPSVTRDFNLDTETVETRKNKSGTPASHDPSHSPNRSEP